MCWHADTIAKATVDLIFAVVPCLNTNLRARFASATPPPESTWKPPPVPDPPVTAQEEEARVEQAQAHKAAQMAQMEAHVHALQNPQPLDPGMVRAPPLSPDWAQAWAQAQAHEEVQKAAQKAGEDAYVRSMALNGWPP
jgi:hypothetical protein